jgi:crossover junction endodeoxyribonuclease RuvC
MSLIIGIDPGLNTTGWGIVKSEGGAMSFIKCGSIKTKASDSIADRLKKIYKELTSVIEQYKPDLAAIEEVFVNMNSGSSMKLTKARAASLLALSMNELEIAEYSTRYIKKMVTGSGAADKNQIMKMLGILMPGLEIEKHDEADAIAIAVCRGLQQ